MIENLEILMKVADAVGFAHARGVIHRDLKPENVMLGEFGEVLVMDWGLAIATVEFRKIATITQTTSMGGTPAYMSPEMAAGPMSNVGPASDVYLLGAMLFEILTGQPPHTGKTVMKCLLAAARNEIVPTTITGELMEIAHKAMATKSAERYPSVREFQNAIRDYEAHSESLKLLQRANDMRDAVRGPRLRKLRPRGLRL
ncbi:MAG: serine/threonine-protein kinase [Pirellulales bacterium]